MKVLMMLLMLIIVVFLVRGTDYLEDLSGDEDDYYDDRDKF